MGEEQGLSAGKMHAIIVAELGEGAVVAARILGTLPSLSLADVGRLVRAGYMLGRSEGLQPPVVEIDEEVFSSLGASKAPSCVSAGVAETPSGGWLDIAIQGPPDAPGNYVNVRSVLTYRYLAYKPDGARQMKKLGRWQRATEHGWENADLPAHGEWAPNYPVPPSCQTSGGEA